ncbi:MAG: hypothetical protein Q4Q07_10230 [Tissierellia bacterium]|nr:hypothetical protein [Tissierellia bacterium]
MEYLTGIIMCIVFSLISGLIKPFLEHNPYLVYLYIYITMYSLMVISGLHREAKIDGLLAEIDDLKRKLMSESSETDEPSETVKHEYNDEQYKNRKRNY